MLDPKPQPYVSPLERSRMWAWNRTKFLQHLPVRTREELWTRAGRENGGAYRAFWGLVLWLIGGPIVSVQVHAFLENEGLPTMAWVVGHLVFWMPIVVVFVMLERRTRATVTQRILEDYAAGRLPVCFGCGYDTRGLAEDTRECPECGERIMPGAGENESAKR